MGLQILAFFNDFEATYYEMIPDFRAKNDPPVSG